MLKKLCSLAAPFLIFVGPAVQAQMPPQVTTTPNTTTTAPMTGCSSPEINQRFNDFARTGRMPSDLGQWLNNPQEQKIEPYQAFDNVYYVGICWVSAWLIKTSNGLVLIDTLYQPFTSQLIENIKKMGFNPADIKLVLLTHGHFDHVGGVSTVKSLTNAKFAMTEQGWLEAQADAQKSQGKPGAWTMPATADIIVKDGDVLTEGDTRFYVYATPGHTWGTASYAVDVKEGNKTYRAITIGGLGLNAIDGPKQVEAYIASIDRIKAMVRDPTHPISVHLTAHPFTTGLTETKALLKTRKPGQTNPLVDPNGLNKQLDELRANATERLKLEQARDSTSKE